MSVCLYVVDIMASCRAPVPLQIKINNNNNNNNNNNKDFAGRLDLTI